MRHAIGCILSVLLIAGASGQGATAPTRKAAKSPGKARLSETKEEMLNRLKLQEARLLVSEAMAAKERAARDYEEMRRLFMEKTLTLKEINDARLAMENAELTYQRALINLETTKLDFLKDATHLTIMVAKKYRTEDNRRRVDITMRNNSNVDLARTTMMTEQGRVDEEALRNLLKVENIIISLLDKAVIGEPYEIIIPSLANGERKTVSFQLLKDVDELDVRIKYLDTTVTERVFLKKESVHELPTIASPQFAQEGNLGSKVTYDLRLEMLVENERSFGLLVVNLPKQIQVTFVDTKTKARVTRIKFTEQKSKQDLRLEISIPEKLDRKYVNKQINFSIVVVKHKDMKRVNQAKSRHANGDMPEAEIEKLPGSRADLQLVPRGVGQLEVLVENLFRQIRVGEKVEFRIKVLNSGTLTLSGCDLEVELPLNWNAEVKPRRVAEILAGDKKAVTIDIAPPEDVSVGNYDIRIKAKGEAGTEKIESTDKSFQVRVSAKSNVVGSAVLVAVLILLVLGIAIVSIRISRS